MRTHFWIIQLLLTVFFVFSCSSPEKASQSKNQKFSVLPVNLSISGTERDTSIRRIFEEAFSKNKVQLITYDEMMLKLESEGKRVAQKVYTKDADFKSAEDMQRALGREHRYVINNLTINLEIYDNEDSLKIYKASWNNVPFPPDFSRHVFVGTKQKEINLTNLSQSIKENIYSIVDSILYSKELK